MNKTKFFDELKDSLELDGIVNETTILHLSSLATLTLIVLIDENFDKRFKATELRSLSSVKTLMDLIGLENFE